MAAVVVLIALALPPSPRAVTHSAAVDPLTLKGALHVHTVKSDGGGTMDEVAAAAAAAGLTFLVITDHGDGRGLQPPSYRRGVLCIDGAEISTDQGHVVAIGLKEAEYPLGGEARDVVEDVQRLGGMAVAAHPASPKEALAWSAWEAPIDGIEWLNADSEWRDESGASLARAVLGYWLRPAAAIARTFDRPPSALARADELAARRALAYVAGHDAHGRIARGGPEDYGRRGIPLPTYRALFETFAVHVALDRALTGDAEADAPVLVRALKRGRVFTGIDGVARPARLIFRATSGSASAAIGDRLIPAGPVDFEVQAGGPPGATIVLLHNGAERARAPAPGLASRMVAAPGAYRVEVHVPGAPGTPPVPWIVSSPIYVGVAPVGPLEPQPGAATAPVGNDWSMEHAEGSGGAVSVSPEGVEFDYHLGPIGTSPYAALVHAVAVPAAARWLSFGARADRPMRISVQLRSPAGGGAGQRWRRSIFVGPAGRRIEIRLEEFRAIRGAAPAVDRAGADSLLFVADTVNADPGSSGRFALKDVEWRE